MVSAAAIFVCFYLSSSSALASSTLLKNGMQGDAVTALQKDLKKLGYFSDTPTGYYGDITEAAVIKLQKRYGYAQDGVAGSDTLSLVKRLLNGSGNTASRGSTAASNGTVLKEGMKGEAVTALQGKLKKLGYLTVSPTGYYGDLTVTAVKKLQKQKGYTVDGIAGKNTLALVDKLLGSANSTPSRGSTSRTNYLMPWFTEVSKLFKIGKTATVYDIKSGLSFKVKRTYGTNHADCEPLTANDTKIMKKIYGGSWSWNRRAVIVTVGDKKIAASINGMPHAGKEKAARNSYISSRSGGYGRGTNLDAVKGNGMDGHFCIHFYGSKTHGTNRTDAGHQKLIKQAAEWAKKNY